MDLDLMRDVEVSVGPQRWKLSRLRAGMFEALKDWLRPMLEARLAFVRSVIGSLNREDAMALVGEAVDLLGQLDKLSPECPLFIETMATTAGMLKMIHLRLLENYKDATEDDALAVLIAAGEDAPEEAKEAGRAKIQAIVDKARRPNRVAPAAAG